MISEEPFKNQWSSKTCNILSLTCHIFQADTVLYLLGCCEDQVRSGRRSLPQLYEVNPGTALTITHTPAVMWAEGRAKCMYELLEKGEENMSLPSSLAVLN